jgi:hypothetical protein
MPDPKLGEHVQVGRLPAETDVLQNAAVANGNGTPSSTSGESRIYLVISNGAGTCTVTVEGSLDPAFGAQSVVNLGVTKLSDSGTGTNTTRSVVSGAISVAANTTYLYRIEDPLPNIQAVISAAASLGLGSNVTGCTVSLYRMPM